MKVAREKVERFPPGSVLGTLQQRVNSDPSKTGVSSAAESSVWHALGSSRKRASRSKSRRTPKGIWVDLSEAVDVALYKPALAQDVEMKHFQLRWGNDYAIIKNPRDQIHYRLETGEFELLAFFDGTRTVGEIVLQRFEDTGDFELSGIIDLVRQLDFGNFFDRRFVNVEAALSEALKPKLNIRRRLREFAKTLTVEWKGAERLVEWFYNHGMRWLFVKPIQLPFALVCLFGIIAFFDLSRRSHFHLLDRSAASEGLILIGLSYTLTLVHELSHALVLKHNGRNIKSAGFLIYFGSTAFFIDSTDATLMDRKQRILMSFAGPYSEAILAGAVSLVAWSLPQLEFSRTLYKFALLNYFVIFMNLVPFLELDGYWIFSEIIQVPNLRKMSLSFVRYDLWHKIHKREPMNLQQTGLALYGILGVAFTIFSLYSSTYFWRKIFGGIFDKLWNGGLIGRTLLIALVLLVAGPAIRGILRLIRTIAKKLGSLYATVVFRLEFKWRVEAAELIAAQPMFEDIPIEELEDLSGRVRLRKFSSGQPVVRQGVVADAFYLVRRGTLHVIEEDVANGNEKVIRTLGRGESFGELGLLQGSPRAATVRALEDAEVYEIDKATFERLLADLIEMPSFGPTLQAAAELRTLPCFSHLEPDELSDLLRFGDWVRFAPGETIVKEGDKGDAFYALESGQVEVLRKRRHIQTQGPGSYFGEVALLIDVPRTATVKSLTSVRAFRVERRGFNKLMKRAFKKGTLNPNTPLERMWEH